MALSREREREEEDDPVGEEAHQSATAARVARAGALSGVEPNPFNASHTILNERPRSHHLNGATAKEWVIVDGWI